METNVEGFIHTRRLTTSNLQVLHANICNDSATSQASHHVTAVISNRAPCLPSVSVRSCTLRI